jgi:energy-coupling factor transport system substrate-specific component
VGVLCGPWAGALTGTLSNTIWGLLIDPNAFPWFPVALFIGFVAGWCARFGLFKTWWKVIISGILIALTSAIASTPIAVYLYGGITASGSSFITAFMLQTGHDLLSSVLSTNFLVEPVDKVATALLAFAIIQGLSVRYVARFPRSENVMVEKKAAQNTQLIIAIAIAAVLIIIAATVLVSLLAS